MIWGGSIFLDKGGYSFEWVLNLLCGYPMPQSLTEQQMRTLQHDLQYFGLDAEQFDVVVEAELWVLAPSPNGVVSEEGLVFTKAGSPGYDCYDYGVLGTVGWTRGVHEWTVVLRAECAGLMIGVSP